MQSPDGQYSLQMQTNGDMVLYHADGRVLWHTVTGIDPGAYAILQADGNFVVYQGSAAVWSAALQSPHDQLCMQSDGNLVIYSATAALWATNASITTPQGALSASNHFAAGQCTWYADDVYHSYSGKYFGFVGNAKDWATNARAAQWKTGSTPAINAIAVMQPGTDGAGSVGHVAVVTEVYPYNNTVRITEMNFRGPYVTDTRTITGTASGLQYIYVNP